jgi:hypothetical protein
MKDDTTMPPEATQTAPEAAAPETKKKPVATKKPRFTGKRKAKSAAPRKAASKPKAKAAPKKSAAPRADLPPTAKIVWIGVGAAKDNPARERTARHKRVQKLMAAHGKTVAEFLKAGGVAATLRNSIRLGIAALK